MSDALYQAAGALSARLQDKDMVMVDPIEFGKLQGAVLALKEQATDLKEQQTALNMKMDMVLEKLSEARGGWKTLMLLGGAASTFGAGLSWGVAHWRG